MTVHPIMSELHAERKARGISQAELARRSGYTEETIRRWEKGQFKLHIYALKDLAEAMGLGVTIELDRK